MREKKDKKEIAKRWFLQALRDLDDAKFNFSGERFNVACFLAQELARYPDALPGIIPSEAFDKDDAERAISLAEKIINFIKSKTEGELY
jgi:HEPN domain-containing protein